MSVDTEPRIESYTEDDRTERPQSRRASLYAGIAAIVLIVGALLFLAARSRDSEGSTAVAPGAASQATASTTAVKHTPQEADEILRQQIASGWVPYGGPDGKDHGWMKTGVTPSLPDNPAMFRTPIYDAPNGTVIGYDYANVGFVSKADADAGFDPVQARNKRFGCDPQTDAACREKLSKQAQPNG